jgi:ornithine carbamoyltransferase
MDGEQSVVFDQAENRLHAQKAILLMLLGAAKRIPRDRGANGKRRRTLA